MVELIEDELRAAIGETVASLAERNGGIRGLDVFYESARQIADGGWLKAHKNAGQKVVGVLCGLIPEELVYAAGAVPARLCSGFGRAMSAAEEICPIGLCPLVRSSLGMALSGAPSFHLCDLVAVPATCDGKKKLAERLARQYPTLLLELPHTRDAPGARDRWTAQLRLFMGHLEDLTGQRVTRHRLRDHVRLSNEKRAAARHLAHLQGEGKIWGRDALLVALLSAYQDPARWTQGVAALCAELRERDGIAPDIQRRPRLLVTGSPILLPTWKLPTLIEESGGLLVGDELCTGGKALWDPVFAPDGSLGSLMAGVAERSLMLTCPCFTPNAARANRLLQMIHELRADGVIYHVLTGCHLYGMEVWQIEEVLDAAQVPMLKIETDYSEEDVEQIRTRLEAFVEMLSVRKEP